MPQKTMKFSANKKWAVSPLISPPAGVPTATQADKFVCILSIGQNVADINVKMLRMPRQATLFGHFRQEWLPEMHFRRSMMKKTQTLPKNRMNAGSGPTRRCKVQLA
jgi:hypothetical protein